MSAQMAALQRQIGVAPDGVALIKTAAAFEAYLRAQSIDCMAVGERDHIKVIVNGSMLPAGDWMAVAAEYLGQHERRNNGSLSSFMRQFGAFLGDPASLPWCGDFAESCMVKAGIPVDFKNPFLARNWMQFGVDCSPRFGAVLVFWRGRRSGISGHVGFYAGEDSTHYHVLGGNQGNEVSVARLSKHRLLGARWPSHVPTEVVKPFRVKPGAISTNEA